MKSIVDMAENISSAVALALLKNEENTVAKALGLLNGGIIGIAQSVERDLKYLETERNEMTQRFNKLQADHDQLKRDFRAIRSPESHDG